MKNRKIVVIAFVLAAVMLIGVGFAVLEDQLAVNGTLGAKTEVAEADFDQDVYFANGTVQTDDTGHKATVSFADNRDTATIEAVDFSAADQKVVVLLTVENDSTEFGAKITPSIATTDITVSTAGAHDPVFTATWEWADASGVGTGTSESKTVAAGDSDYILVTITLTETPTEEHSATFTVTYDVESVE